MSLIIIPQNGKISPADPESSQASEKISTAQQIAQLAAVQKTQFQKNGESTVVKSATRDKKSASNSVSDERPLKKIKTSINILSDEAAKFKLATIVEVDAARADWLNLREILYQSLSSNKDFQIKALTIRNKNKEKTALKNLVIKCFAAYNSAENLIKLSHNQFKTKFQHCWTVENVLRFSFSGFKTIFNSKNIKFGFVTSFLNQTQGDLDTIAELDADSSDNEYIVKKLVTDSGEVCSNNHQYGQLETVSTGSGDKTVSRRKKHKIFLSNLRFAKFFSEHVFLYH